MHHDLDKKRAEHEKLRTFMEKFYFERLAESPKAGDEAGWGSHARAARRAVYRHRQQLAGAIALLTVLLVALFLPLNRDEPRNSVSDRVWLAPCSWAASTAAPALSSSRAHFS